MVEKYPGVIQGSQQSFSIQSGHVHILETLGIADATHSVHLIRPDGQALHVYVKAPVEKYVAGPKLKRNLTTTVFLDQTKGYKTSYFKPVAIYNAENTRELNPQEIEQIKEAVRCAREKMHWHPLTFLQGKKTTHEPAEPKSRRPVQTPPPKSVDFGKPEKTGRRIGSKPEEHNTPESGEIEIKKRKNIFDHVEGLEHHQELLPSQRSEEETLSFAEKMAQTDWFLEAAYQQMQKAGIENPEQHREVVVREGQKAFVRLIDANLLPKIFTQAASGYRTTAITRALSEIWGKGTRQRKE